MHNYSRNCGGFLSKTAVETGWRFLSKITLVHVIVGDFPSIITAEIVGGFLNTITEETV